MQMLVDDVSLHVESAGTGEAVVLLHGFPFSSEIWSDVIPTLAKTHRVIAPDFRGMGRSQSVSGPYLMETLASDIAAIIDTLQLDRVTLVGHSAGGYVALAFFRMFSERIKKFAMICSRFDADSAERAQARNSLAERCEREGINAVIQTFEPLLFAPQTSETVREKAREIMEKTSVEGATAMLRGIALRSSAQDLFEEFRVPVLLAGGGQDRIVTPVEIGAWGGQLPACKVAFCERSGHLPMLEEPSELAAALSRWLSGPQ